MFFLFRRKWVSEAPSTAWTSSIQCYPSTQPIFLAQSKCMHQGTNIMWDFNLQLTINWMHVFLVLKEMGLKSLVNCATSSIQCYPSNQPKFVFQSKGMHQGSHIQLDFNHQFTTNVMHFFLVLNEMGPRSLVNCSTSSTQFFGGSSYSL